MAIAAFGCPPLHSAKARLIESDEDFCARIGVARIKTTRTATGTLMLSSIPASLLALYSPAGSHSIFAGSPHPLTFLGTGRARLPYSELDESKTLHRPGRRHRSLPLVQTSLGLLRSPAHRAQALHPGLGHQSIRRSRRAFQSGAPTGLLHLLPVSG